MKYFLVPFSILVLLMIGCSSTKLTTAKLHIIHKDYNSALPLIKEVIQDNENIGNSGHYQNAEVYYMLGYIEGELENYNDMLSNFDKSLAINDNYKQNIEDMKKYYYMVFFNKGVNSYNKKDYQNAQKHFEFALVFNPNDKVTENNLAYVKYALNEGNNSLNKPTNSNTEVINNNGINNSNIIASFNGNGIKNTKLFKTDGPWEIHWNAKGTIFQVYLYSSNGEILGVLASQSEADEGSSFWPKNGEFYLNVNTNGNWEIKIFKQ